MKIKQTAHGFEASVTLPVVTGVPVDAPFNDGSGEAPQVFEKTSKVVYTYDWVSSTWNAGGGGGSLQLTGDVTAGPGASPQAATISPGAVTLAKMANLPANTFIGNNTGGPLTPIALSVAQTQTALSIQPSSAVAITGGTITGTAINLGGNSLIGDTVSGGTLALSSTSNGTKGPIQLGGTGGLVYNEATQNMSMNTNDMFFQHSVGFMGIGTATPRINGGFGVNYRGLTCVGTATACGVIELASLNPANTRTGGSIVGYNGTNFITEIDFVADGAANSGRYNFYTNNAGSIHVKMQLTSAGSLILGDSGTALTTTATDGFLYIPSCAGAPTGVPTAQTGTVPIVFDTTDGKIYYYNGSWKSTTPA